METKYREIKTVMHPLKTRTLTVARVEKVNSYLKKIVLTGDLSGFTSLSPDDHIKVFFAHPGEEKPVLPTLGPNGLEFPEGRKPIMRDYTPRKFDPDKNELEIDFVLHQDGVGSNWAKQADVGQTLTIGGPRGSRIVPFDFDWYLMVGDETAIPSIARRLEELPAGVQAVAVIEVDSEADVISFETRALVTLHWVFRNGQRPGTSTGLRDKVMSVPIPAGDYFAWIATEKSLAMEIKNLLMTIKGAQENWIKATGYWHLES